jgi:hypothetical protein
MTAKWKWIPLISGALVALLAGQTRLEAADGHDGLRDYLKKEMRELRIPGMQVAVVRHQKIVFLAALGMAEVGNAVPPCDTPKSPFLCPSNDAPLIRRERHRSFYR